MIFTKTVQISSILFGVQVFLVTESHSLKPQQQVTKNEWKATEVEWSLLINQVAVLRLLNESSTSSSLHERELQEMRDLRLELDTKTGVLKNDLINMKKEMQNMTAESLHEIVTSKEEAKHALKEAVLNASLQQDERELQRMRELRNDLQEFKTTTMKEFQNMTATINDIKASNEETRKNLNEVKETITNLSRQAAIITTPQPQECKGDWSEFQSSCYRVFKTRVTHVVAKESCRTHGAYLASIGSERENSFVHGFIVYATYIGLDHDDQMTVFTWQDSSPFNYSNWASSEPNNYRHNQDVCIHMSISSYWHDQPCTDPMHYACEKSLQ